MIKKPLPSLALIALCLGIMTTGHAADVPAQGIIVYTKPPSTYPQMIEFATITPSTTFSVVVRPNGSRVEIPSNGIAARIDYPQPDSAAAERGPSAIKQIEATLQKYPRAQFPDLHAKLTPIAAKWKTALSAAPKLSAAQATPLPVQVNKPGMTITTLDGQKYENVVITTVTPDGLSFDHSDGAAKVDFQNLPVELQRKYNYDPVKAEVARNQAKEAARSIEASRIAAQQAAASTPAAGGLGISLNDLSEKLSHVNVTFTKEGSGKGLDVYMGIASDAALSVTAICKDGSVGKAMLQVVGLVQGEELYAQNLGRTTFALKTLLKSEADTQTAIRAVLAFQKSPENSQQLVVGNKALTIQTEGKVGKSLISISIEPK